MPISGHPAVKYLPLQAQNYSLELDKNPNQPGMVCPEALIVEKCRHDYKKRKWQKQVPPKRATSEKYFAKICPLSKNKY